MQEGNYTKKEMLLWCIVSDNLNWRNHILDAEQPPLKLLTSRVNALSCPCTKGDFRTKLMAANGIVMSKVCYLIKLWGGCEGYLLHTS